MSNPSSSIVAQKLVRKIQHVLTEQYRSAFSEAVKNGIAKSKAKRAHLRPVV